MSLSPQWLDELRARITLSSVIGRTTKIQKAGREWKACCPFHNEKTPSFTINDEKGFYHCFGCGAHGDVIRWMTDNQGLPFMDAVKELAAQAGMEVPAPDPRAAQAAEQRASLHDVMAAAQEWFVSNLRSAQGARAREYLQSRGFSAATIEQFGFGFAPEGRQALKQALAQFDEPMLIEAGLRISVEERDPYDRFRGRLMLPIQDARGRVIAFGGRILDSGTSDAPKYLNSPDTPLFDKGRTLYNLHRAAPAARAANRLIVVEGYMDVIALANAGISEAVAPMGTALTEPQIELLWRQVDTPTLCFDGDTAGQRAAMRAISRTLPLLRPSHSMHIVNLPHGMDPDDIIKRAGLAGMEVLLDESFSLLEALWYYESREIDSNAAPEAKAGIKARLAEHIDTITDGDIRSLYRKELFTKFAKFAFKRDDWTVHGPKAEISDSARRNRLKAIYRSDPETFARYMHQRLGAAIAKSFVFWPHQLKKYAEQLSKVEDLDPRIDVMIDSLDDGTHPHKENFLLAIELKGLKAPSPKEFDYLRFPFSWELSEPYDAITSLKEAVSLYSNLREARRQLKIAQERYERDFDHTSELEKNRLFNIMLNIVDQAKSVAHHLSGEASTRVPSEA